MSADNSIPTNEQPVQIPYLDSNNTAQFDDDAPRWYIGGKRRIIHCKNAAFLSVTATFTLYVLLNAFVLIMMPVFITYYTLLFGCTMYVVFLIGYRLYRPYMVIGHMVFLVLYCIVASGIIVVEVFDLLNSSHAPTDEEKNQVEGYDKAVEQAMIGLSAISLGLSLISLPLLYYFVKYLVERSEHVRSTTARRGLSFSSHLSREDRSLPPFTISYPPPCPPTYEVAQHMDQPAGSPKIRHASNSTSPPRYTDFRPAFYAEPPPYVEK